MREFQIRLQCVQDVQEFIALVTTLPFGVTIGDGYHWVNGSCFMEMFCLDPSRPLTVRASCTDDGYDHLLRLTGKFRVL